MLSNRPHFVIGLFGASESGKSIIANKLEALLRSSGVNVAQYGLADPLKEACLVFGVKKGDPRFRAMVCGFGDVVKAIEVDLLWDMFKEKYLSVATPTVYLLNDPRYVDQAEHCDFTVKLVRSSAKSRMNAREAAHVTETDWERIRADVTYHNENSDDPDNIASSIMQQINARIRS